MANNVSKKVEEIKATLVKLRALKMPLSEEQELFVADWIDKTEEYCGFLVSELEKARKEIADLQAANDEMKKALILYATRENWTVQACDSYSGAVPHFDYPGDLQDEPWEVAEQALSHPAVMEVALTRARAEGKAKESR